MTPDAEKTVDSTSDHTQVLDPKIIGETTPLRASHVRYTKDELLKLRPDSMSPPNSAQAAVKATVQAAVEAPIKAPAEAPIKAPAEAPIKTPIKAPVEPPTPEEAPDTLTDVKTEAEQKPESGKEPKTVTFEDGKPDEKPNAPPNLLKRASVTENTELENGDTIQPTEGQADGATPAGEEGKKKKKKKKSSGRKKKPNPTGFEEFYADPPVTPAEYDEEVNELYHHARPFAERIETCIQRYRARRKLDEVRANIFNKYLALGGIDTTIKAFTGGMDKETLEDYDGPTIANIQARDVIFSGDEEGSKFYDPCAPDNWVVDFEGIARAYLSSRAPYLFGMERQDTINTYCNVVKNFLNYVLMHSVCPEHTADIIAAQQICDLAKSELWTIHTLAPVFPGSFHRALSTICNGYYGQLYVDPAAATGYMTHEHAHRTLRAAVALMGTAEQFAALAALKVGQAPTVLREEIRGYEIVAATPPTANLRAGFAGIRDAAGRAGTIPALGLLECRRWAHPDAPVRDETAAEERARRPRGLGAEDGAETFWVDEEVLARCVVGMKFFAMVRECSGGITYIDHLRVMHCSFFRWVENERMEGWKAPRENERLAPSCEDGEEAAGGEGGEGDFGLDD